MNERTRRTVFLAAVAVAALPLWVARSLPLVDLPQHLHLISVLHRLDDPGTLYAEVFARRGELTPYLGYYYAVHLLSWLLPLTAANKLFLSAYVVGLPVSVAFLLRSLGRPRWPALLTVPFAYGDSFAWGFVNYCAAVPLGILGCALWIRSITDRTQRIRWAVLHALTLVAVLLFHVQVFGFLALALPFLLVTTRAPEDAEGAWARGRWVTVASALPGVLLFLTWVVARLGAPAEVAEGEPWKAWGPMLSPQNLSYKPVRQNLDELWGLLANQLRDGSDRYGLYAVVAVGLLAVVATVLGGRGTPREGRVERFRLMGLAGIAGLLFLFLPFDIRGYMYYLNSRFAHLLAPLVLAAVPPLSARLRPRFLVLAAVAVGVCTVPLARGFRAFSDEAAGLRALAEEAGPKSRVMALVYDPRSAVVFHPVFLHAGAEVARASGGFTNFSFASTPHSPLRWRDHAPPTFPSEWDPRPFRYETLGAAYDTFLVRGPAPERVFGPLLQSELEVRGRAGNLSLVKRR